MSYTRLDEFDLEPLVFIGATPEPPPSEPGTETPPAEEPAEDEPAEDEPESA